MIYFRHNEAFLQTQNLSSFLIIIFFLLYLSFNPLNINEIIEKTNNVLLESNLDPLFLRYLTNKEIPKAINTKEPGIRRFFGSCNFDKNKINQKGVLF